MVPYSHMKTTVDIPDRLFKLLRVRAAAEQTTMRELLAAALQQFLGGSGGAPRKKFKLKDGSVRGNGLAEEFQDAEWAKIREEIYRGRGGEQ